MNKKAYKDFFKDLGYSNAEFVMCECRRTAHFTFLDSLSAPLFGCHALVFFEHF